MSVKYLNFDVDIHGVRVESYELVQELERDLKTAVHRVIVDDKYADLNFRDSFGGDVEVSLDYIAGKFKADGSN